MKIRFAYDGKRLAQVNIHDDMPASTFIMAYLRNNEPTKATRLFMDYCRSVDLSPLPAENLAG